MSGIKLIIKNMKEVEDGLRNREAQVVKAVNATTRDFKSRAHGWIAQEVVEVYAIKKRDIKDARKEPRINGKISIAGIELDNVEQEYEGHPLTPIHFKMTPRNRPKKNRYRVKAEIKKGSKANFPTGVFLADNGGGTQIPFQREKGAARLPVKSIKSVSVPQMITNKDTADRIKARINTEVDKRLKHNLKRFSK